MEQAEETLAVLGAESSETAGQAGLESATTAPGLTGGGQAGWGPPGGLGIALLKGFLWKLVSDLCQEQPSGNN